MENWQDYLGKLDDEKKRVVKETLERAMKLAPNSVAELPYGVPGLKLNGKPLIAVAAHKEHYGIYPFSPKVIEGARDLIGDIETAKGTIRFNYGIYPTDELLKKLIELRSEEIK
jgi:uncharacterized protein YdhG (YjbR/CyaY superfamily)